MGVGGAGHNELGSAHTEDTRVGSAGKALWLFKTGPLGPPSGDSERCAPAHCTGRFECLGLDAAAAHRQICICACGSTCENDVTHTQHHVHESRTIPTYMYIHQLSSTAESAARTAVAHFCIQPARKAGMPGLMSR